ncbi:hypothetical protein BRADI_4g11951v3 [Brachypodium distachyon]|uniref:Uncharacterized protein n=1 Tax=Brachypodium distachyon TaxID=15368 RepID=A0A2K2CM92_BRADI|nr:hypothetical protein BRADI_4g11951v3 [Brachypodium distachyon]
MSVDMPSPILHRQRSASAWSTSITFVDTPPPLRPHAWTSPTSSDSSTARRTSDDGIPASASPTTASTASSSPASSDRLFRKTLHPRQHPRISDGFDYIDTNITICDDSPPVLAKLAVARHARSWQNRCVLDEFPPVHGPIFLRGIKAIKASIHPCDDLNGSSGGGEGPSSVVPTGTPMATMKRMGEIRHGPQMRHLRLPVGGLEARLWGCVLCLAAFPSGAVFRKRLLIHRWIGRGSSNPPMLGRGVSTSSSQRDSSSNDLPRSAPQSTAARPTRQRGEEQRVSRPGPRQRLHARAPPVPSWRRRGGSAPTRGRSTTSTRSTSSWTPAGSRGRRRSCARCSSTSGENPARSSRSPTPWPATSRSAACSA